jgi:hypothetical protein
MTVLLLQHRQISCSNIKDEKERERRGDFIFIYMVHERNLRWSEQSTIAGVSCYFNVIANTHIFSFQGQWWWGGGWLRSMLHYKSSCGIFSRPPSTILFFFFDIQRTREGEREREKRRKKKKMNDRRRQSTNFFSSITCLVVCLIWIKEL